MTSRRGFFRSIAASAAAAPLAPLVAKELTTSSTVFHPIYRSITFTHYQVIDWTRHLLEMQQRHMGVLIGLTAEAAREPIDIRLVHPSGDTEELTIAE